MPRVQVFTEGQPTWAFVGGSASNPAPDDQVVSKKPAQPVDYEIIRLSNDTDVPALADGEYFWNPDTETWDPTPGGGAVASNTALLQALGISAGATVFPAITSGTSPAIPAGTAVSIFSALKALADSVAGALGPVANIAARPAASTLQPGQRVTVIDASDDPTVEAGRATYESNGSTYFKVVEEESLDQPKDAVEQANAPSLSDDSASGFSPGSHWVRSNGEIYVLIDDSPGGAVWEHVNAPGTDLDMSLNGGANLNTAPISKINIAGMKVTETAAGQMQINGLSVDQTDTAGNRDLLQDLQAPQFVFVEDDDGAGNAALYYIPDAGDGTFPNATKSKIGSSGLGAVMVLSSANDGDTIAPGRYDLDADAAFSLTLEAPADEYEFFNSRLNLSTANAVTINAINPATETFTNESGAQVTGPWVLDVPGYKAKIVAESATDWHIVDAAILPASGSVSLTSTDGSVSITNDGNGGFDLSTASGVQLPVNVAVAETARQFITNTAANFGITDYLNHLSDDPDAVGTLAGQTLTLSLNTPLDLYLVGPTTEGTGNGNVQHNGTVTGVHFTVTYDGTALVYNVVQSVRHHPGPGDFATRTFNSVVASQTAALTLIATNFDLLFGPVVAVSSALLSEPDTVLPEPDQTPVLWDASESKLVKRKLRAYDSELLVESVDLSTVPNAVLAPFAGFDNAHDIGNFSAPAHRPITVTGAPLPVGNYRAEIVLAKGGFTVLMHQNHPQQLTFSFDTTTGFVASEPFSPSNIQVEDEGTNWRVSWDVDNLNFPAVTFYPAWNVGGTLTANQSTRPASGSITGATSVGEFLAYDRDQMVDADVDLGPVVAGLQFVESVAGTNVDNTDPLNPIVLAPIEREEGTTTLVGAIPDVVIFNPETSGEYDVLLCVDGFTAGTAFSKMGTSSGAGNIFDNIAIVNRSTPETPYKRNTVTLTAGTNYFISITSTGSTYTSASIHVGTADQINIQELLCRSAAGVLGGDTLYSADGALSGNRVVDGEIAAFPGSGFGLSHENLGSWTAAVIGGAGNDGSMSLSALGGFAASVDVGTESSSISAAGGTGVELKSSSTAGGAGDEAITVHPIDGVRLDSPGLKYTLGDGAGANLPPDAAAQTIKSLSVDLATGRLLLSTTAASAPAVYQFSAADATMVAGDKWVVNGAHVMTFPASPSAGQVIETAPGNADWVTLGASFATTDSATIANGQAAILTGDGIVTWIYNATTDNWAGHS